LGLAPSPRLSARAPAKVNLSLHVLGRRPDGYHDLESLVAFAGIGDDLSLEPGDRLSLEVEGPTAPLSGPADDNLVLRATRALADRVPGLRVGAFRLIKRLPVAAGIGGGSSDAAAALRLLARLNGLSSADPALAAAARQAGADVPVCLDPRARMMRGVGDAIGPPLTLPRLHAVLLNPGVPVETPRVFGALGLERGERLPRDAHPQPRDGADFWEPMLASARNDLEKAALSVAPIIGEALDLLRADPSCHLARMSGSGASVFGLYADCRAAAAAAKAVRRARPEWWVKPTVLR
jgi:4-diphosphocytidyl-2-C-methyl-D-erythritol kinase